MMISACSSQGLLATVTRSVACSARLAAALAAKPTQRQARVGRAKRRIHMCAQRPSCSFKSSSSSSSFFSPCQRWFGASSNPRVGRPPDTAAAASSEHVHDATCGHAHHHQHHKKMQNSSKNGHQHPAGHEDPTFDDVLVDNDACWSCGGCKFVAPVFCGDCGVVQPCKKGLFYRFLSVPESFDIDVDDLTCRYRELQTKLHPDKFSRKSEEEQKLSKDLAAELNHAVSILRDPLERARYLLKLHDFNTMEEGETLNDPELLMEIMELREEIDAAQSKGDTDKLQQIKASLQNSLVDLVSDISSAFAKENFPLAQRKTVRLSYIRTALEEVL